MRELAARLDHVLVTAVSALLRQDVAVAGPRGELRRATASTWVGVLVVAFAVALLLGRGDSWAFSIVASLVLAVPVAMIMLRAVIDEVHGSYIRGGPVVVVLLVGSFLGALLATQPI